MAQTHMSGALTELFRGYEGPPFAVRLWDGSSWSPAAARPLCTLVLTTPSVLETLIEAGSQVALGEAFLEKKLEIEGDLFSAFAIGNTLLSHAGAWRGRVLGRAVQSATALRRRMAPGHGHASGRDAASIAYHYDQPVEFFRSFLGPTLVYSCAYFESAGDSLDDAQRKKLEHICRKLRLGAGERFLDIGCGWGSLVLHAAQQHGARSRGITLSREQEKTVRRRIVGAGLGDCCAVGFEDYRQLDSEQETYDKMASVGMAEHVGLEHLPDYFAIAHRILRPGGVFLNHAIARAETAPLPRGRDSFIARYVFPDGELVTLTQMLRAAEGAGFEVRDVENLREHYERTLRCWVEELRAHREEVLRVVPETTYRIWLLYMAGCAAAFERGEIAVYQTLLSRPDRGRSGLPLTRDDWYPRTRG